MTELYFDKLTNEPELIRPWGEIGVGIRLCYDEAALNRLSVASVRKSSAVNENGDECPYVIVDGTNFTKDDWFNIEIWWPDDCQKLEMRLRAYPCTYFSQRFYFNHNDHDGQYVDLPVVATSDSFFNHVIYKEDLHRSNGVPRDAHNFRLNLMVPTGDWFALGVMSIDRIRDA